jgi:ribosomal protein S18 acetylase RimI-like enzyme
VGWRMNEVVDIRIAHEEDADAIRALTREAYAKWVDLIGREPLPMRVDYSDAIRKHRFDLLYVGDRLAALIETVPEGDCLLIENVAVLPAFQGRGFGTRLLKLAEELAASSGLAGMRLYTNKLFLPNIRLYEALGYRVEREEELNGGVAVHMMKSRVRH